MKIRIAMLIVALSLPAKNFAQTAVNKTIPVRSGQKIVMHFDYPELIRVSTWDKNEVSVQGTVSINAGENDDAFVLETSAEGNTVNVSSHIKNMKSLPQRITVFRDGQKIMFRDKAELK